MKTGIVILWLLNLFDAISTHLVLSMRLGVEANPLMAWLYYDCGPAYFFVIKMLVISACSAAVWNRGSIKAVRIMIWVSVAIYGLLALWHVFFWITHYLN